MADKNQDFGAWNPGLNSEIPQHLLPLVTLYRSENSDVSYREAREAADFCGLEPQEMVAFKVSRLVIHELLIRVTADLHVPDGPNYEELGLNLRSMADAILNKHIVPKIGGIEDRFARFKNQAEHKIGALLERDIFGRAEGAATEKRTGFFARLVGKKEPAQPVVYTRPEFLALEEWKTEISRIDDKFDLVCFKAVQSVVHGIVGQRGSLLADKAFVLRLASNLVCNSYGSEKLGEWIEPIITAAAEAEGFKFLPYQAKPYVLNVKGASAAGKSTIRPLQRELAGRLGLLWEEFALISPDYWRKFLLDADSLGDNFKYAAMLTGQELEVIDKKLDRYIEQKADRSEISHLLIDRFRFDSFSSILGEKENSSLLSRFGNTVFLFFVITPPADTVERAWKRGLDTGRYKAVDDLLYHNIEAYTGIPQLFFSWIKAANQKIHFEFLDNSVPNGDVPRTVAFGWNENITILDIDCMWKIDLFKNVNIDARNPDDVLFETRVSANNFLQSCIERIPKVTFADHETAEIVGQTVDGEWVFQNKQAFGSYDLSSYGKTGSDRLSVTNQSTAPKLLLDVGSEKLFTVGNWAGSWEQTQVCP